MRRYYFRKRHFERGGNKDCLGLLIGLSVALFGLLTLLLLQTSHTKPYPGTVYLHTQATPAPPRNHAGDEGPARPATGQRQRQQYAVRMGTLKPALNHPHGDPAASDRVGAPVGDAVDRQKPYSHGQDKDKDRALQQKKQGSEGDGRMGKAAEKAGLYHHHGGDKEAVEQPADVRGSRPQSGKKEAQQRRTTAKARNGSGLYDVRRHLSRYNESHFGGHDGGNFRRNDNTSRMRYPEAQRKEDWKNAAELLNLLQTPQPFQQEKDIHPILDSGCFPKHHIFFGKVHKTGSSTVANIIQRYGFSRRLNFASPRKRIHSRTYNYINQPGHPLSLDRLIPPPLGQSYDIVWNHAVYNATFFHSILPPDTFFFTILRSPLSQFQSTFEFYGRQRDTYLYKVLQMNVSNPLSYYLHNYTQYEHPSAYMSYLRNKQAQDLGMTRMHVINATLRRQYIQQLGKDFPFVMLTEFFDESLLLLRRLLCWSFKDIIYIRKNTNKFKKKRVFSEEDRAIHESLNVADYDLYKFFLGRFKEAVAVAKQQDDFNIEVAFFKQLITKVASHCYELGDMYDLVVKTPLGGKFLVTPYDCKLMMKSELLFLDDIMIKSVRKYHNSVIVKTDMNN